jgi:hypothetical protein
MSEPELEVNQYHLKGYLFLRCLNLYMYNYKEYIHIILYKHDMIGNNTIKYDTLDTMCLFVTYHNCVVLFLNYF